MSEHPEQQQRPSKGPYAFAIIAAFTVVLTAWVARDFYQPIVPGADAPGFEVRNLDGKLVSLDDYRGKVVLVNIWATWCAPCREEMPSMQRLYEQLNGTDFEILAVSVDAEEGKFGANGAPGGDVAAFVEQLGLTFPILHDPSAETQYRYQATGLPESFLVDRDGVVQRRIAGGTFWDAEQHVKLIRRLLDGSNAEQ